MKNATGIRTWNSSEDFALSVLSTGIGAVTISEALALGGARLVSGLKALTKRKKAVVVFERGAYRAVAL